MKKELIYSYTSYYTFKQLFVQLFRGKGLTSKILWNRLRNIAHY